MFITDTLSLQSSAESEDMKSHLHDHQSDGCIASRQRSGFVVPKPEDRHYGKKISKMRPDHLPKLLHAAIEEKAKRTEV